MSRIFFRILWCVSIYMLPSLVVGHNYRANGLKSPGLHISTNPSNRLLGQDVLFCLNLFLLSSIMDPSSDVKGMMLSWRALYLSCVQVILFGLPREKVLDHQDYTHKCTSETCSMDSMIVILEFASMCFLYFSSQGHHQHRIRGLLESRISEVFAIICCSLIIYMMLLSSSFAFFQALCQGVFVELI